MGGASGADQVTDQTLANRVRERAKLMVRGVLHRVDLDLSRDPYTHRLARTLDTVATQKEQQP